jgi:hypothetical protein
MDLFVTDNTLRHWLQQLADRQMIHMAKAHDVPHAIKQQLLKRAFVNAVDEQGKYLEITPLGRKWLSMQ